MPRRPSAVVPKPLQRLQKGSKGTVYGFSLHPGGNAMSNEKAHVATRDCPALFWKAIHCLRPGVGNERVRKSSVLPEKVSRLDAGKGALAVVNARFVDAAVS